MFPIANDLEQVEFKLEKNIGIQKHAGKVKKDILSCIELEQIGCSPDPTTNSQFCFTIVVNHFFKPPNNRIGFRLVKTTIFKKNIFYK